MKNEPKAPKVAKLLGLEMIVAVLRETKPVYEHDANHIDQWHTTVLRFAEYLQKADARFSRKKFLNDCGYLQYNGGES